jgi:hypothetical protein
LAVEGEGGDFALVVAERRGSFACGILGEKLTESTVKFSFSGVLLVSFQKDLRLNSLRSFQQIELKLTKQKTPISFLHSSQISKEPNSSILTQQLT